MKLKIVAADDEPGALEVLCRAIRQAAPDCELWDFNDPQELLAAVEKREILPDVAFLDIEMYGISGLGLAKELKDRCNSLNVIFVTGYSKYMGEAFSLHASGYVLKPARVGCVRKELDDLRIPIPAPMAHVRIQAFGNFEVFVDGKPLPFRRSIAKEILAYLVDLRGASATTAEIAATLFENRAYDRSLQQQMQVYIRELLRAFREAGVPELVLRERNRLAVDTGKFACDYYDFLNMEPYALRAYHGKYMANYSWAEFTTGWLEGAANREI